MSDTRSARLEWARRRAAGELEGVGWVDTRLQVGTPDFTQSEAGFHARSFLSVLPAAMREAVEATRARGEPTLVEGLQLLMADAEWLVESRALLWAADSPEPQLLGPLVESFGLGADLHHHAPDRLQRLVARLRPWNARRGEVDAAVSLLASALDEHTSEQFHRAEPSPDEVFACRSARWWAARGAAHARLNLRIDRGWTLFQPSDGPLVHLRAEDILVDWTPGRPIHRGMLRLLPVWGCYRVAIARETSP